MAAHRSTCAAIRWASRRWGRARCVNEELDDWNQLAVLGHHASPPPVDRLRGTTCDPHWPDWWARSRGEVVAMNSLTVNLHLLMASFYRPQAAARRCIVIEARRLLLRPPRGDQPDASGMA